MENWRWAKNDECPNCGGSSCYALYVREGVENKTRRYCHKCGYGSHIRRSKSILEPLVKVVWPPLGSLTQKPASHTQLTFRKLSRHICTKYDVRVVGSTVLFPCVYNGKVLGYKCRDFSVPKSDKNRHMYIVGKYQHMFGWNTVHTNKTLAIALGEFDAMAVTEAAGIPCISSPNGDNGLVKAIKLDYRNFENFEKIIFIPDQDKNTDNPNVKQPSQVVAEACEVLGQERCWVATPSLDDPNEYLMQGKTALLKQLVWSARPASQDLWHESSRELIQPIAFGRLTGWEEFDRRVQGLRMCEVTYVLGQPGAGKTTFLCWLMWLMSQRSINMAALILEGSVRQFVTKLSHTFYGGNIFTASDEEIDEVSKEIDRHIHFAKQPEKIELAIRTAVIQYDVEVIVVDNITAISDPSEVFASTSQLVTMFDQLASELCIHIIVLSHVKVNSYGEKADIGSAAGSRDIGAKAYNMLALHQRKEVGLIKCRERGEAEGWWPLIYDPHSCRYIQGSRVMEFSDG